MPYTLKKTKFYVAVATFEAAIDDLKNYQKAFNRMLKCAKQGNLYALYYLQYMLDPKNKIPLEPRTQAEDTHIKDLFEVLPLIPKKQKPKSWLEASCEIIALRKAERANKPIQPHHKALKKLSEYAPNAARFLAHGFS